MKTHKATLKAVCSRADLKVKMCVKGRIMKEVKVRKEEFK
jgi:hypothetical protein